MKNEERFFRDITDALHAHEDAYIDGAWETFLQKKKRRRFPVYIRLAGAAALLLLLGYAALLYVPKSAQKKSQKYQAKTITRPHKNIPKTIIDNESLTNSEVTTPKNNREELSLASAIDNREKTKPFPASPDVSKSFETPFKSLTTDSVNIAVNNPSKQEPVVNSQPAKTEIATTDVIVRNAMQYNKSARLNYDSLAGLKKPEKTSTKNPTSNKVLSYALQLSPSVGNEKMNFGTGVELGYKLSKNFSVSAGIGYSYINAGANRGTSIPNATLSNAFNSYAASPSSNTATATSQSQSVKGVTLALSGLEVPLSFQYKTAGGLYFSAGVAAMSIIGNNLSYNYLNNRAESVASANGLSKDIRIVSEVSTQKSTENIRGYVGFYTFSAGKKINIGCTQLKFAPFVKIPFTGVSSEKIQLLHGGVQLGIGF